MYKPIWKVKLLFILVFISDSDQLSDEQFEKLLDFADEIQSVSVIRAAEAVCAGCDGKNCVSCQNFKTITGQE